MSARKKKSKRKGKQQKPRAKLCTPQLPQTNAAQSVLPEMPFIPAVEDLTKSDAFLAGFLSDLRKERAAQLLAEDALSVTAIASAIGVVRETIYAWQREPEVAARIEEIKRVLGDLTKRFAVCSKGYRINSLQQRLLRMELLMDARASSPEMEGVKGGETGLLVRDVKAVGKGEEFRVVELFRVDTGLLRELREHEKQAAQEAGQWVDKVAPTTPDGKDEYTGIPAIDLDEFRKLPIAERIRLLRTPLRIPPEHRE